MRNYTITWLFAFMFALHIIGISMYVEWHQMGGWIGVYKPGASLFDLLRTDHPFYQRYVFAEEDLTFLLRKMGHFIMYGFIAILLYSITMDERFIRKGVVSILATVSVGISDEIHQFFLVGRSGRLMDVFIDTAGATTAIVALVIGTALMRLLTYESKKEKGARHP